MNAPPLLRIMQGRKARPRKAVQALPRERVLHVAVADILRRHCRPQWRFSHFPAGEARDARTGAMLKKMGLQRGWPDFLLIAPDGRLHALELKRGADAALTPEQAEFRDFCIAAGIPHIVAGSIDRVLEALEAWDAISIRLARIGNGRKIED
jgi:hypothetical protein